RADFFMAKLLGLCCMYTTKGRSQIIEEIYTHSEAQMQLIFSKKTQNITVVVKKTTLLYYCNKKPT
ncbi:MAG: hypothetical protein RKP20_06920, partial [Candidatus Competibacter sp.]|nr:hypothetical protein [Candidatus Competibacter sp.]